MNYDDPELDDAHLDTDDPELDELDPADVADLLESPQVNQRSRLRLGSTFLPPLTW